MRKGGTVVDKRKLLIAESSGELAEALAELFRSSCQVRVCTDGNSAKQQLGRSCPDVLVLDLMLPGYDGLSLLQWAGEQGLRPQVLVTTRFCSNYVVECAQSLGVRYLMLKPCSISAMASHISSLLVSEFTEEPKRRDSDSGVRTLLMALGIRGNLHGYNCIYHAVTLYARDPMQSVTKVLYPEVAKRCGCKASHVERNMRSAIESAWTTRNEQIWRLYFPTDGTGTIKRPTNTEFLARMAQCLENRWEEMGQMAE